MKRIIVLLSLGVMMVMVVSAVPGMAQTKAEQKQAAREAERQATRAQIAANAAAQGVDTPEEAAAATGVDTPQEAAAAKDGASEKSANPDKAGKELPKSGGVNTGSLLGLGAGAGALLIGSGLLVRRSRTA